MIMLALILCFVATAICTAALLTFMVSISRMMGLDFPWPGPFGVLSTSKIILLGWGQLTVAVGLLLASRQAYALDRGDEADDGAPK